MMWRVLRRKGPKKKRDTGILETNYAWAARYWLPRGFKLERVSP